MIARIKYSKYGIAKFLGHLDVVRYFQKAIRRSGLDVSYSEGFHPHQLLYFAAPLGLGQTSDAEYMDAELKTEYPSMEIKERLNAAMSEGFEIQSVTALPDRKPNQKKESIMSMTACADYMVSVKDMLIEQDGINIEYPELFSGIWKPKMAEYCGKNVIMAEKATKKNVKIVNIKPMIFAFGFTPESIQPKAGPVPRILHAEHYKNGLQAYFKLASGSTENLKPELIMEAFCKEYGIPYQQSAFQFHRLETYCDLTLKDMGQEEMQKAIESGKRKWEFVPLSEIGKTW